MLGRMVSLQTVQRLPLYLREVRMAIAAGEEYISSAQIAKDLNIDPVLTRKDLSITGVNGVPRKGFHIPLRHRLRLGNRRGSISS